MTKQELLAVLDMSEDEQVQWLVDKRITDGGLARSQVTHKIVPRWIKIEFADLAFRLRDEAGARFYTAMRMMYDEITNDSNPDGFSIWWMLNAKPIHWIIAALIAKDKDNG